MLKTIPIIPARDGNLCEKSQYIVLHMLFSSDINMIIKSTHLKQSTGIVPGNIFLFLT